MYKRKKLVYNSGLPTQQAQKMNYLKIQFNEIAQAIKAAGFIVYAAENGKYGFFTDHTGERVVCFQISGGLRFSGKYAQSRAGTGWQLAFTGTEPNAYTKEVLNAALYEQCPRWANSSPVFTTEAQYLAFYNASSKYTKI